MSGAGSGGIRTRGDRGSMTRAEDGEAGTLASDDPDSRRKSRDPGRNLDPAPLPQSAAHFKICPFFH
jgi:hypothetical protein